MDVVEQPKVKHVHVETTSRDCDGRLDRTSIDTREFHTVMGWQMGIGHVTTVEYDLNDDHYRAYIGYPTEEGHHGAYIWECSDDCDVKKTSQRDHTAEAAGY